jgi:hypothetical protein
MEAQGQPDPQSSADDAESQIIDDTSVDEINASSRDEDDLSGVRIRQIAALRRGAIRARSWCLIAAGVCVVGAIQLIIKTVQNVRHEHAWGLRPTGFVLFAIAGLMVAVFFFRRAAELKREIDKPMLPPPETPPDFEPLSDGSQRWKNLEDIH